MKWTRLLCLLLLSACCCWLCSCGVRKKTVKRTQIDSVHVKTEINTDYQRATITNLITESKTIDLTQFEAKIIDYDSLGRVTRETIVEQRTESKKNIKIDSASKDSINSQENIKTDSVNIQKKETDIDKHSDTSWMQNVGKWTLLILGGFAIVAFFVYRLIKNR